MTIIEQIDDKGVVKYSANGNLPLEEVAKAAVSMAFNLGKNSKTIEIPEVCNESTDKKE